MWEYKEVWISKEENLEERLNDYGKDNWELVYFKTYFKERAIFKRKI